MTDPLDLFAEAAARYCAWCRSEPRDALAEARTAARHLARLYQLALDLRPVFDDHETEGTNDAEWQAVYRRMAALPFSSYWEPLRPIAFAGGTAGAGATELGNGEAGLGDLRDDLADIDRDLTRGLRLYDAGHRAAAGWDWRFHFGCHWGDHAAGALRVLHEWLADNGGFYET